MLRPLWMNIIFPCFGGGVAGPPPKAVLQVPKEIDSGVPAKQGITQNLFFGLVPVVWPYLSASERLALRASCVDGRRVHDTLVTNAFVCDDAVALSSVPAARLPRYPLPTFRETQEVVKALQGLAARGCKPHLLFLCFVTGHERQRHEEGLAVLLALSNAASKLSAVHLCGVPLTPQVVRALKTFLPAPAPATCTAAAASPPPSTCKAGTAPPSPSRSAAAPSAATLAASLGTASQRTLTAVSTGPPDLPLTLNLYGYDLVRQPAGVAVEMLVGAAAPRLARLELWGCVGWPQRLGALLQGCAHLRHFTVSFQPLIPPDGIIAAASGAGSETKAATTLQQRAAAALASGAVVTFPPLSAAATTSAVVKTIGGLHHLRSLELRGCVLNLTRRTSVDSICPGGAAVRPRTCAATKAAAERAATAAAAPSVQQLASALYQLTRLTRLAIDKINSATPLLSAVGAMHGLRHLELPDAIAPTAAELAAITRAAPRLATLTLGSVGPGSVLDAGGSAAATATAAATAAPEVLPLPPTLAVLRLARCRPTLRTMRSLQRTVEARAEAPPPAAAPAPATGAAPAAAAAAAGGAPPRMGVVVPGIEIDMLDVEFDALQGFSRGSDGVMRSTLLPESAEALAAAIRLLVPPPAASSAGSQGWGAAAAADGDDDLASHKGDGGGGVSGVITSSMAGSSTMPSFVGSGGGPGGGRCISAFGDIGGAGGGRDMPSFGGGGAGGRFMSYFGGGGGGSGIVSTFGGSVGGFDDKDIDGGGGGDGGDGEGDWAPPAFGQAWTRSLVIHNAQGSLSPPSQEQQQQHVEPARHLERLPEAEVVSEPRSGSGGSSEEAADAGCVIEPSQKSVQSVQLAPPLTGHAIWIAEMLPLGLLSLELYGVGVMEGDLEVIAELHTLRRLTLSSGELEVDALPCLAALPSLEYLELARCHPCRHRRRAGRAGFSRASGSIGVARASVGTGFSRASGGVGGTGFSRASGGVGGAGFSRASGGVGGGFNRGSGGVGSARVSCADSDATADADGAQADGARPTGKRALLELCLTAPRLRHVFVIRCSGMMSRAEGAEGPLGAEWVRQRLLAAGPRNRAAPAAPPPAPASGEGPGLQRSSLLGRPSWLGRPSKAVAHQVTEEELGWPQIRWD